MPGWKDGGRFELSLQRPHIHSMNIQENWMSLGVSLQKSQLPMTPLFEVRFSQASMVAPSFVHRPFPGNVHELVSTDQLSPIGRLPELFQFLLSGQSARGGEKNAKTKQDLYAYLMWMCNQLVLCMTLWLNITCVWMWGISLHIVSNYVAGNEYIWFIWSGYTI